jgi:hypothetical protein
MGFPGSRIINGHGSAQANYWPAEIIPSAIVGVSISPGLAIAAGGEVKSRSKRIESIFR